MTGDSTTSDRRSQGAAESDPQGAGPRIRERVHSLLVDEFELAESDLVCEANLYTDLGLDSLDSVDLVVALKEEFGFAVDRSKDEERVRAVLTLDDLYGFVKEKMSERNTNSK